MRADKFLYVFYVLQYVNGHAAHALINPYLDLENDQFLNISQQNINL